MIIFCLRNWKANKKLCCHTTVTIKYYSRMDNFERTKLTIFYGNPDNFRFKSINITSFTHGGAISLVKLRKVSQIRKNSPWFTLFAIHFYSNLYHSVVPGSDFRIYNLASLFTPREAISSLLLDQCIDNPEDRDWKRLMFCACHP